MNYNDIILHLIKFIHLLFIIFILSTPFTTFYNLLSLYVVIVPIIMIHWILNNNQCGLTVLEKILSKNKENDDEYFTYKLISPIYDFNKNYNQFSLFIWIITIILWIISIKNLNKL
jgi:hypothetical protein